ncbi:MAG: hypothetical protein JWO77_3146 [Ilumatobacteraceae bacterium]|nr:hypothetical protein [Ilumatobacteraceae bacterium]
MAADPFDDPVDLDEEVPARRPVKTVRKLNGAMMLGMGRALGQIYDPKPPTDTEIEQEASDDQLDPDQPVRIELGDTPATSVARVRRS